jgi:thymidylate synthase (FAD)
MAKTQNSVELIGFYGSDLVHCTAAWTSTSRDLTPEKQDPARQLKLLKMLASENHHTPFERSVFHFLVSGETASHIHLLKHRIGVSINGESARYRELKSDKYHIPRDWPIGEQERLEQHCLESFDRYHKCLARLVAGGMDRKRAKESARFYLPYANSLVLDMSMTGRALFHFLGLRYKESAQLEIREIAGEMLQLVRDTQAFPLTLEAFGYAK